MKLPALKEIIEERKEKAIEDLSAGFSKNKLPLEEYERLVEYINKIESERELVVIEKIVAEYSGTYTPYSQSGENEYESSMRGEDNSPFHNNLTFLSTRTVSGPVKQGAQHVNILGSQRIKIRTKDLPNDRTDLQVISVLGECVIYVESGIRVTNKALPILGGSRVDNRVNKQARNGYPELLITGVTLLGEIRVKLLKE